MQKNIKYFSALLLAAVVSHTECESATLTVPGTHATVSAAINALSNGDILEIAAGVYTSGIISTISKNDIVIRGAGGRAHLNADGVIISNGKAVFVTTGSNITIENIEFSHARVVDSNGAGIRHEGGLLTVRNSYFHDNENGILTSNQGISAELVVENSEFAHNGLGSAGYTHNIYVGHIGKFTFRYSYSHHATHGHNIKSRAQENYILYSRIMDEATGNASYQIDLPNGGLSYIIGNSIHQGSNAENSRMISYAAEGATNPFQEVYLSSNTLVNDRNNGWAIRLSGSPVAVIVNNIFDNFHGAVDGSPTLFLNNTVGASSGFVDREAFDYHLIDTSSARDSGIEPGSYHSMSLVPVKEYTHPLTFTNRLKDSQLDCGAYEYATGIAPPGVYKKTVVPANYLLLR